MPTVKTTPPTRMVKMNGGMNRAEKLRAAQQEGRKLKCQVGNGCREGMLYFNFK